MRNSEYELLCNGERHLVNHIDAKRTVQAARDAARRRKMNYKITPCMTGGWYFQAIAPTGR